MRFVASFVALAIAIGLGACGPDVRVSQTEDRCLLFVQHWVPTGDLLNSKVRRSEVVRRTTPECTGKP